MPDTFRLIASGTVTGSAGDIQFTNIPQTYTDLRLVISAKGRLTSGVAGAMVIYTATGQSSTLSTWLNAQGDTSGTVSYSSAYPIIGTLVYNTTNIFGITNVYIPNYTSSAKKFFSTESITEAQATQAYHSLNGLMIDYTSPISFLGLGDGSAGGGLAVGTTASLYGIKNS